MAKDFERMIKDAEDELLALKTSSPYSSIRSASFANIANVQTGYYRVTYKDIGEPIFSIMEVGVVENDNGGVYARTPSGNTQIIEVSTSYMTPQGQIITTSEPLTIVSNAPVISVVRL